MRGQSVGLAVLGAALAMSGQAHALDEVYVGVMAHNICVTDCKNADKEDGPVVELQADFESPEFLHWAYSPRPYVVASLNVAGDTSFVGVGLDWRFEIGDKWAISPGVGYVVHNGETNLPYPDGSPEAAAFTEEHVLLGSRDLFRTTLGVSREIGEHWEVQGFFSHLSHGQILGNGRNQGMDQLGVRFGYRFGG
jgi:lipid A 3-O-deacylase